MNVTASNSDIITFLNNINHNLTNITKNNYGKANNTRYDRKNTSRYCWTYGACSHHSHQCRTIKDNHQDRVTFKNKKGGSTLYYPSSTSEAQE